MATLFNSLLRRTVRVGTSVNVGTSAKASDYGTWALSRFTHLTVGRVQPVLEVDKVISMEKDYMDSIEKRKLSQRMNVARIAELYEKAKNLKTKIRIAGTLRENNSQNVQAMLKSIKEDKVNTEEIKGLRETGKSLREELRTASQNFNSVNDELVDLVLSLPNTLDPITPVNKSEMLREISPAPGKELWRQPVNLRWEKVPGIGPYPNFATGSGVWAELELAANCQKCLLQNGFRETGNVDFVKRILLEGTGMDPDQFLRIREGKVRNSDVAHATYLVGGASFPAFLALFAQSLLHSDEMLPIRYFVIGRYYEKNPDGSGTLQQTNVQAFVACRDEKEEEEEFHRLSEIMEKFYADDIGLKFRSNLLSAPELRTYEKKKISFVTSDEEKVVGDLASVGDYVSKRLLCCYIDPNRSPRFLHMITGQFLNITDFLLPKPDPKTPPIPASPEAALNSKLEPASSAPVGGV